MKIFCDIDGVLGDVVNAALRVYPKLEVKNVFEYHYNDYFWTNGHTWQEVFDNEVVYQNPFFQPYPHVVTVLRWWREYGYDVEFISARPTHLGWVTEQFIKHSLHWVGTIPYTLGLSTEDKFRVINSYLIDQPDERAIFIEDNPKALDLFVKGAVTNELFQRLKFIQYAQPYNLLNAQLFQQAGIMFSLCNGWMDVANTVEKIG